MLLGHLPAQPVVVATDHGARECADGSVRTLGGQDHVSPRGACAGRLPVEIVVQRQDAFEAARLGDLADHQAQRGGARSHPDEVLQYQEAFTAVRARTFQDLAPEHGERESRRATIEVVAAVDHQLRIGRACKPSSGSPSG